MNVEEVWKDIKGYEGLYLISNFGRVKALERTKVCNKGYVTIEEHLIKPVIQSGQYYRAALTDANHVRKYHCIHRLVAQAFIPNPDNLPQVNHIDGNKENNHIDNLEWCTVSYNLSHAYKNGLRPSLKLLNEEIEDLRKEIEKIKEAMQYRMEE